MSLPQALGGQGLVAWRLETTRHLLTWTTGEGAFQVGGRWSSAGHRVIYTSLNPATAILEVAVHKGMAVLDTVPHTLLEIEIKDGAAVHVIPPADIPNPNWLVPGWPSDGQQKFGDQLLEKHAMVVVPSVVSPHSWNLIINVAKAADLFALCSSKPFALDPRLNAAQTQKKANVS